MMHKPKMSDEAKFLMVIILLILSIPLIFYLVSGGSDEETAKTTEAQKAKEKKRALTVLISEAKQAPSGAPVLSKEAVERIRNVMKHGDYSTAHLQLNKVPKGSPQYREVLKEIIAANSTGKGIKQIDPTPKTPLRYIDASTPRNRQSDAIFLYLIDDSGAPSPWFCIQTVGPKFLGVSAFRIKADGVTVRLKPPTITIERGTGKITEFYDAPLNRETYAIVKRLVTAKKAEIVTVGATRVRQREIGAEERKAMQRILDLYGGLGGNIGPFETK